MLHLCLKKEHWYIFYHISIEYLWKNLGQVEGKLLTKRPLEFI